jgi:hypothetical protein
MALKKALTVNGTGYVSFNKTYIETGDVSFTTNPLYIKVESVNGTKNLVSINVSYTDEEKKQKITEKSFAFTPSMDANNFIAQAYVHLKTLPEFAGATDC